MTNDKDIKVTLHSTSPYKSLSQFMLPVLRSGKDAEQFDQINEAIAKLSHCLKIFYKELQQELWNAPALNQINKEIFQFKSIIEKFSEQIKNFCNNIGIMNNAEYCGAYATTIAVFDEIKTITGLYETIILQYPHRQKKSIEYSKNIDEFSTKVANVNTILKSWATELSTAAAKEKSITPTYSEKIIDEPEDFLENKEEENLIKLFNDIHKYTNKKSLAQAEAIQKEEDIADANSTLISSTENQELSQILEKDKSIKSTQNNKGKSNLEKLPEELLIHTFRFFGSRRDLARIVTSSKYFHYLVEKNNLLESFKKKFIIYNPVRMIMYMALSHKGDSIAIVFSDRDQLQIEIQLFDSKNGELITLFDPYKPDNTYVHHCSMVFSKDDQYLIVSNTYSETAEHLIFDLQNKKLHIKISQSNETVIPKIAKIIPLANGNICLINSEWDGVRHSAFTFLSYYCIKTGEKVENQISNDKATLLAIKKDNLNDKTINLYDVNAGSFLKKLCDTSTIYHAEVLPGNENVIYSVDNKVKIKNIETENEITIFNCGKSTRFFIFDISKSGKYIALLSFNKIYIVDIAKKKCINEISSNHCVHVYFSADDDRVFISNGMKITWEFSRIPFLTQSGMEIGNPLSRKQISLLNSSWKLVSTKNSEGNKQLHYENKKAAHINTFILTACSDGTFDVTIYAGVNSVPLKQIFLHPPTSSMPWMIPTEENNQKVIQVLQNHKIYANSLFVKKYPSENNKLHNKLSFRRIPADEINQIINKLFAVITTLEKKHPIDNVKDAVLNFLQSEIQEELKKSSDQMNIKP